LFASAIKRHFNVKDYGKLFPGHGGVLDRFDSTLAIALVMLMVYAAFGSRFLIG
jgi:phosphatidate cytidylyltransferase